MEGRNKFNIFRYATISVVVFFIVLFFHADISLARENVYAPSVNITEDTIWTLDNSPYVISGWAWMDVNAVLTIESGVVIKFVPDNWNKRYNGIQISNGGKIIAQGTEENPIIFTSYYDDKYSGDTNADADASSPVAGDWRGIIFDGDESILEHVKILYAANIYQSYGAIDVKNSSSAQFSNSTIQYCAGSCVRLNEPNSALFSDVIISDSADYGIYSSVAGGSVLFSNSTIQNCVDGIAKLSAGNTISFNNITFSGNKNAIELSGSSISNNAIWPKIGSSYYILNDVIEILPDAVLTIEPGLIIKSRFSNYPSTRLEVKGQLLARGTEDEPIIFTSLSDNPSAGDWGGLYFENSSGSELEYVQVKYGGRFFDDFSGAMYATTDYNMVHLKDSVISVTNSEFTDASTVGVLLQGASSLIMVDSVIATTTTAILSLSSLGSTISGSSFENNSSYAINNLGLQIIAQNNWWGDNSGPIHEDNVDGEGQVLIGDVLFDPWIGQNPGNIAPVLSFAGDSGYESDGIEPNISFVNEDIPVFKVLFSDADADDAQYVRLVMGNDSYAMATSSDSIFLYEPDANMFSKGTYNYHFEASDGTDSVRLPEQGELSFDVQFIPVILVPGIMGTELYVGEDKIWPDIIEMLTNPGDDFMNVLAMNFDGTPIGSQISINDIIRKPAPGKDIFDGLIDEFIESGYVENTDLFVFPYDWRLDIYTTSELLGEKINTVLNQANSQKIDIIVHSMGGLLAKKYILNNSSSLINKIIFIGTPHLGATQAAKTLLFGDSLSMKIIFPFLSSDRVKYISQNMLSIYQLLPSREYINQSGFYYYDQTQSDIFDFDKTTQFLTDSGLSPILLDSADDFHSGSMDNFDTTGLDIYNINGCDTPTITTIIKRDTDEYSLLMYEGDGTVPLASSEAINTPSNRTYYFKGISHATMPSADGIKELVTQIITESEINLPDSATQDCSQCHIAGKLVSVHSPVNLHIYDSQNNHVGRGENGDIEYNISGVAYEEIGENKFVFLPASSAGGPEYRIELDGTGEGTFSLRVSKIEDSTVTETAYYSDIPVSESSEATITLATSTSETILQVDEQGTGSFEQVAITAVLDSAQSADMIKPSTTISISGNLNASNRYISSASITLSSLDDNAGILKTEYSINSGATWIQYANSFIINTIGETVLLYRAIDRAGNVESVNSQIIGIDSPASVILAPFMSSPVQAGIRQEDIEVEKDIKSKVLGVEVERPKSETYTKDEILNALAGADIDTLLDYLGKERDIAQEESVAQKYNFDFQATNFVCYGTKSTDALGTGERAGVIYSFEQAFGRMPSSTEDWNDVIRISTNQVPVQRNASAEQKVKGLGLSADLSAIALAKVEALYSERRRSEGFGETDILSITYGLRPEKRDLELEIQGISKFVDIFGKLPSNTMDWNILRSLVY